MRNQAIVFAVLSIGLPVHAGLLDSAWIEGRTQKAMVDYKCGEEMVFTLTPRNLAGEIPAGEWFLDWKRTGDDGLTETGRVEFTREPFVYRTKIDKPGFVRLCATVVDESGNRYQKKFLGDPTTPEGKMAMNAFERQRKEVFFDGGAGAEIDSLRSWPEPWNFDAFWAQQWKRLDLVPIKDERVELPCENKKARLYAVEVRCAGLRPVTGYLSIPADAAQGKKYAARLETHGYSGDSFTHDAPTTARDDMIVLNINPHGLRLKALGGTEDDRKALRWEVKSHDKQYAFDRWQNSYPELAYFNGMVLRVKRALQYLKTLPEWNGQDLYAAGGSQGGLQSIWAAGCGEGVTGIEANVPWCCDIYTNGKLRLDKCLGLAADGWYIEWTDALGYYDACNFAKRIPQTCFTHINRAGLGDYCCPPAGIARLWNNIPGNKRIIWVQGSEHGYVPPVQYAGRDVVREVREKPAVRTEERRLPLAVYRDKMKGAWIGQIVGVCYGAPTEFKWRDSIIPREKVPIWRPEMINGAFGQDDIYVEMTFLRTLEQYGVDVSIRQAGIDFANSEYPLWCANNAGRMNLRKGIAPPASSHPMFNTCANGIDYQIEADYSGIIAPGCPQEVIRLGNLFGRLMNFGDGVWAGQFIGALYSEAFFTSDVNALLDAGLAAIPAESDYATMVRRVRAWHAENPDDWTMCWETVRANYSSRANPALRDALGDIDVRLNGAAVVLGLLYGGGDFDRTLEITTRCGWDSDCNPSSAAGILGCAQGFARLDTKYSSKLDQTHYFAYTPYTVPVLYDVSEKLARQLVAHAGGRIEKLADGGDCLVVPKRAPVADPFVPSWQAPEMKRLAFTEAEMSRQKFAVRLPNAATLNDPDPTVRVQKTLDALSPNWKTSANAPDMWPGYRESVYAAGGQTRLGCLMTHPPRQGEGVVLSRQLKVPEGDPRLKFEVAPSPKGNFRLLVRINGETIVSEVLGRPDPKGEAAVFKKYDLSLERWIGQEVAIELVNEANDWCYEAAIWHDLRITANNGTF